MSDSTRITTQLPRPFPIKYDYIQLALMVAMLQLEVPGTSYLGQFFLWKQHCFSKIYSTSRRNILHLSQTIRLETFKIKALLYQVKPRKVKGLLDLPTPNKSRDLKWQIQLLDFFFNFAQILIWLLYYGRHFTNPVGIQS